MRLAINGLGRMGRLALRHLDKCPNLELVLVNEPSCDAAASAHLIKFDSIHGIWDKEITADDQALLIEGKVVAYAQVKRIEELPLVSLGIDIVLECSGAFRTQAALAPYFERGVHKVVVSAPLKDKGLNIVMGINDHLYNPDEHQVVTAASCTTNCLAPIVGVLHEHLGIRHGSMTTIHDITNTQTIIDKGHKDLRRARACQLSLIPTTTGSAKAITTIFPELEGKLNGLAVRVPVLNASIVDAVFEVNRPTSVAEVNGFFKQAAAGKLAGILGYEERPLVSVDYKSDPRSGVVDALSTMVIDQTQVKILAFYDNEMGYVHRMVELAGRVADLLSQ